MQHAKKAVTALSLLVSMAYTLPVTNSTGANTTLSHDPNYVDWRNNPKCDPTFTAYEELIQFDCD